MKMKYFRLLFGEAGGHYMHLGELKDSVRDERFTFLYLKKVGGHVEQMKAEHTLFLCPECIDLLVLDQAEMSGEPGLAVFLQGAQIKTLVIPEENGNVFHAEQVIALGSHTPYREKKYCMEAVGWRFYIEDYSGSVLFAHGPAKDGYIYEDCVVHVKEINRSNRCCVERDLDGYGCTYGCTLHREYDVCRCKADGQNILEQLSVMLLPDHLDGGDCTEPGSVVQEQFRDIRFWGLTKGIVRWYSQIEGLAAEKREVTDFYDRENERRYFIGSGETLDDATIGKLCRDSMRNRVVVLQEGRGLCCSGFLKYTEE